MLLTCWSIPAISDALLPDRCVTHGTDALLFAAGFTLAAWIFLSLLLPPSSNSHALPGREGGRWRGAAGRAGRCAGGAGGHSGRKARRSTLQACAARDHECPSRLFQTLKNPGERDAWPLFCPECPVCGVDGTVTTPALSMVPIGRVRPALSSSNLWSWLTVSELLIIIEKKMKWI